MPEKLALFYQRDATHLIKVAVHRQIERASAAMFLAA
jgi:hypothetical protein